MLYWQLESLKSDCIGQYSIRINDQWRICFVWQDGNAYDVVVLTTTKIMTIRIEKLNNLITVM